MGINKKISELKNKAVFLDQDGTIIKHVDLLHHIEDVKLLPEAAPAIKQINKLGFLTIVVTNQPVVARGLITLSGVRNIQKRISDLFVSKGAKIDALFFCPHHPNATLKKYRLKCFCRKPKPGLIFEAAKKFNIDLKRSFMVGDAIIDMVAGKRARLKTILVKTGPGHSRLDKLYKDKVKPDFETKDLLETVKIIKNYG